MTQNAVNLPGAKGTYALIFNLEKVREFTAGRLGSATLPAGGLIYIGSAHGPGGLASRVRRHLADEKKRHWHIDSLTSVVPVVEVWYRVSDEKLECNWAERLRGCGWVGEPFAGFGASDCRCSTHLFSFPVRRIDDLCGVLDSPTRYVING